MLNPDWNQTINTNWKLIDDEIHVWLIDVFNVCGKENKFDSLLSPDELQIKNKFHFSRDRKVYGASRGILRSLLSNYLELSNEKINFEYNKYGKPYLRKNIPTNICFNISHSKEYAVIALNIKDEIGIDIEYINGEMIKENIAENYFSKFEVTELLNLEEKYRTDAFFRIWTRKEAYIKAKGKGLSIPLDSFDVSLDKLNPQLLRSDFDSNIDEWNIYAISINDNYCGAIVNSGMRKRVKQFLFKYA